ncbi:MAG: signal recognition particle-docking protein FtsY [Oscillospiraceae bacterium]
MGFFEKLKDGMKKTRESIAYNLFSHKIDDEFFEELEERLILSDAGAKTASRLVDTLKNQVDDKFVTDAMVAVELLKGICCENLEAEEPLDMSGKPAVILLIGVNGAGKTTTAGKLAKLYKSQGKSVILAAADTFRAAAVDQLRVWAERSGVGFIEGANDPAAVIYDAVSSAQAKGTDIVVCDTAGRLHTKKNLMDELAKMSRIIKKASSQASVETLLVLDAVTGQNAINQAREFAVSAGVSGIVLTKLDGTSKGGSVMAIKDELGIPVRYIGVGEGIDDLDVFVPREFCDALFGA